MKPAVSVVLGSDKMTIECRICGEEFDNLVLHVENSKDHPPWADYKTKYSGETGFEGENNPMRPEVKRIDEKD